MIPVVKSRSWFNRLLFTYLPIFYLAVGLLIFLFLMVISQMMERQMTHMSESYGKYVTQQIESSLQNIERLMIAEIHNNTDLKQYLYGNEDEQHNRYMLERTISKKFNTYLVDFPLIDSIYVVRIADKRVLSTSNSQTLDGFGDQVFIDQMLAGEVPLEWSGVRSYSAFKDIKPAYPVVSLAKTVTLISPKMSGILVVNVSASALARMVRDMNTLNVSTTSVYDQHGTAIIAHDEETGARMSSLESGYTGWQIYSGVQDSFNYSVASTLKEVWVIVGLASLVFFTGLMIYFARRYTDPIDRTMGSIKQYFKSQSRELPGIVQEHSTYMDQAVHHLIDVANQISDVNKENVLHRHKQFFADLMRGDGVEEAAGDAWLTALEGYARYYVGVVEIDQYAKFCETYHARDQYLLKYVMSNVASEVAGVHDISILAQWLSSSRMTILYKLRDQELDHNQTIYEASRNLHEWIAGNLDYAVSIGLGSAAYSIKEVARSYQEAEEALSYIDSAGNDRIIAYWELEGNVFAGMLEQLQAIRDIAEAFKQRNKSWRAHFDQLMDAVQGKYFHQQDIMNLLHFMMFHISKEVSELPTAYRDIWEGAAGELQQEMQAFETISQLRHTFALILGAAIEQMDKLRPGGNSQELLQEVKAYIEENYSNSELSLQLLSDQFQMNQSYLSRLFKEAFSENFVDYVTRIRMERARFLLTHTEDQIQHISQQVGYAHYFSFSRVFKRVTGVTPGEYRKQFADTKQATKDWKE